MHLTSLSVYNFRNYEQVKLELLPGPVILVGKNGAGKTNLLEAISFLTPGRGFRRATLSGIDRNHANCGWAIVADMETPQGPCRIATGREIHPEGTREKRSIKLDGKAIKSQSELARLVPMQWLVPAMDGLFMDSDTVRRRFLDRMVLSFDPVHSERVSAYEHAMRERGRLLEENSQDHNWLSILEEQMAEHGLAMAIARRDTVLQINAAIYAFDMDFPKASIAIYDLVGEQLEKGFAAADIIIHARQKLSQSRAIDAASGRCTYGLHRCNMQVMYTPKHRAASECSTGEQKAMLLSITLGLASGVKMAKGVAPILLLDEVVAHLDISRRAQLGKAIHELGSQAWLTGTDASFFTGYNGQVLHVEEGVVQSASAFVDEVAC